MMGHSPNAWVLPGGHLEVHESFEHGICREIVEETGLVINENQPKMFLMYENSNKNYDHGTQLIFFFKASIPELAEELTLKLSDKEVQKVAWIDHSHINKLLTLPYDQITDEIEVSDEWAMKSQYPLRDLKPGYPNDNAAGSHFAFGFAM